MHREWVAELKRRRPLFKGSFQSVRQVIWCINAQDLADFSVPERKDPHLKPHISFFSSLAALYIFWFVFVTILGLRLFANHLD